MFSGRMAVKSGGKDCLSFPPWYGKTPGGSSYFVDMLLMISA